jgi:muramoyltetrapeptide carboxypeptidase
MELKKGDKIGIIALAGACDNTAMILAGEYFKGLGYNIEFSKNINDEYAYFAGNDEDKVSELHRFFEDPSIKLIMNARGGYGSIRLLDKINYKIIKNNPKPFVGYSDITALLLMIYKNTGLTTYHGPMFCPDFAGEAFRNDNLKFLGNALAGKSITLNGNKVYKNGRAKGIIWGGNLTTMSTLCGQNFIPEEDFILFAEDLNEPVYKIDRMLQQLLNIEQFRSNCKGIIFGEFLNTDNEAWLEKYFTNLVKRYPIPVSGGFNITHSGVKVTIPIGRKSVLNGSELVIESY